jgi:transcriptional regulator with XRE-family HTH domain
MDIKKRIGLRIKELRKKRGLSQEEVSAKADITAKHLSSVELGKENPTLDTFLKLSRALNVDLWELLNYSHQLTNKEIQARISDILKISSDKDARLFLKLLDVITK